VNKKICIAGVGTYGSYIANAISETYPDFDIILIEVGNNQIQSEAQIGFKSELKGNSYNAAKHGRYFGLGGTSSMWGGQLLFLSENDCPNDASMDYIKNLNIKHTPKVLSRFFDTLPDITEDEIGNGLYVKKGIWLHFNKRNLFKYFNIAKKRIELIQDARVLNVHLLGDSIKSISIQTKDKHVKEIYADLFFLSCGAIESVRILDASGLIKIANETVGFCDHVSTRSFRIQAKPFIAGHDFSYRFVHKSLLTTRIIGEYNGVAYFIQPVFNEEFRFFQFLKELIFKRKFSFSSFFKAISQFVHIFPFAYQYFIKKKLYVYGNWELNIDVELNKTNCSITNSNSLDAFGVNSIKIDYSIPKETYELIEHAKASVRNLLAKESIQIEELNEDTTGLKLEDTYHPFRLYQPETSFLDRFNPCSNLYVCHTGLLDRAGGLNPTAVLFCLIEELIEKKLNIRSLG
jgi:hypothetical protein